MSAVIITDALARHFKDNVAGVKEAYATGQGGMNAPAMMTAIADTPVVHCYWQSVEVTPGSFERTHWTINADAYFNGADVTLAYATYVQFVDDVRTSIRSNWTLFGTATQISSWSGGPPEDTEVDGEKLVRLTFTFDILEAGPQTYIA